MRGRRSLKSGLVVAASAASMVVAVVVAPPAEAATTTIWVPTPACAPATPGHATCFAMVLRKKVVPASSVSPAAPDTRPALVDGPAGGYSPAEVAAAYGFNPGAATTQTVAIVDAFNDPSVASDLAAFDSHYGLPAETSTSFKVLNQNGLASPLPSNDADWAREITLDVQAVRGLCHQCKILLIEATSGSFADLGTAVDQAVTQGATIVSNSYGGPEGAASDSNYNHPGVAVLASTGDDGWYGWNPFNVGCPGSCATTTDSAPSAPASYNTVIGVGGTSLYLNPDGTRASETVWNDNGPGDYFGLNTGQVFGAAGSGCSGFVAPKGWQASVAGYSTLGCGTKNRNGVDIAALADPFTGFDIFQTFGNPAAGCPGTPANCWETLGGTSLASPAIAAMWGLAGGPGGVTYPSLSLYGHFNSDKTRATYDVTVGGTGLCNTATPGFCTGNVNPNSPTRELDCRWDLTGSSNTALTDHYQCYAKPGYDGVSGVGTPIGLNGFKAMGPTAVIKAPGTVTHGVAHTFSAVGTSDPFPGGTIVNYSWNWGDGHTTNTASITVSHTYASAGSKTITLTVTDNYGRKGKRKLTITVG